MIISEEEKVFFMPIEIFAYKTNLKHDQKKIYNQEQKFCFSQQMHMLENLKITYFEETTKLMRIK